MIFKKQTTKHQNSYSSFLKPEYSNVNKEKNFEDYVIFYLLIALSCMNVFESGALVTLALCVFALFREKLSLRIDFVSGSLMVVAISCMVVSAVYGWGYSEYFKALNFPLIYMVGYKCYKFAKDKELFIKRTAFFIFLGFFIQLVLQYGYNYGKSYNYRRMMYSIWTNEPIAVTAIGLLSAAIIGYSFYGLFCSKNNYLKVTCGISIILTIIVNIDTATRTPIILLFICFVFMFVIYFSNKGSTKKSGFYFVLLGVIVLAIVAYYFNFLGLRSYLESSYLFERFEDSGIKTSRTTIVAEFFRRMPDYPFGGGHIKNIIGRSAHNFLQEAYDMYGCFSFVALLCVSGKLIAGLVKIIRLPEKSGVHFILLPMEFSMFIQCLLEPVLAGYPVLLWMLLLLLGISSAKFDEEKETAIKRRSARLLRKRLPDGC